MLGLLALNTLSSTDTVFFIVLAVIVALVVAVYFLIPVFNKKQYKEQRENLKKREIAFKSNLQSGSQSGEAEVSETTSEVPVTAESDTENAISDDVSATTEGEVVSDTTTVTAEGEAVADKTASSDDAE